MISPGSAIEELAHALWSWRHGRLKAGQDERASYIVVSDDFWRELATDLSAQVALRFAIEVSSPEQKDGDPFATPYRFMGIPVMRDHHPDAGRYRIVGRDESFTREPTGGT